MLTNYSVSAWPARTDPGMASFRLLISVISVRSIDTWICLLMEPIGETSNIFLFAAWVCCSYALLGEVGQEADVAKPIGYIDTQCRSAFLGLPSDQRCWASVRGSRACVHIHFFFTRTKAAVWKWRPSALFVALILTTFCTSNALCCTSLQYDSNVCDCRVAHSLYMFQSAFTGFANIA